MSCELVCFWCPEGQLTSSYLPACSPDVDRTQVPGMGYAVEAAVLPRRQERTEVSARAYGPARTVDTGDCRSTRSCVGKVEALPALTRIGTCLSVKASRVRAKGTRQAADKGFGVCSGIVCIFKTGVAGLRACLFLVLAGCARRAGLTNLLLALTSLRTRNAPLLVGCSAIFYAPLAPPPKSSPPPRKQLL